MNSTFRMAAVRPLLRTSTTSPLALRTLTRLPPSANRFHTAVVDDVEEQIQRLQSVVHDIKNTNRSAEESLKILTKEIDAVEVRLTEMKKDYEEGNASKLLLERKHRKAQLLAEMYRIGMDLVARPRAATA
ncbi:hypothetical protein BC829DRAFT_449149 [Chytridium lagenaria]|nr:hypothetical protein BC829DRAFT_449149 [Chytridium lagenaria]